MERAKRLLCSLMLPVLAAGCQRANTPDGSIGDSTFVHVMGALRRLNDDRMLHPVPPYPMPLGPNGSVPTVAQLRRRDSLQTIRNDSVRAADSAARVVVLERFKVTPDQLGEAARLLALTPQKSQRVMEAVARESIRLDSMARLKSAAPATTKPQDTTPRT